VRDIFFRELYTSLEEILKYFSRSFPSFSSFVRVQICTSTTRTLSLSLSSLNKDDLHVLHGVAEQQRSIEDGVVCDSHEIVSEIFERLDHGCVVCILVS